MQKLKQRARHLLRCLIVVQRAALLAARHGCPAVLSHSYLRRCSADEVRGGRSPPPDQRVTNLGNVLADLVSAVHVRLPLAEYGLHLLRAARSVVTGGCRELAEVPQEVVVFSIHIS